MEIVDIPAVVHASPAKDKKVAQLDSKKRNRAEFEQNNHEEEKVP